MEWLAKLEQRFVLADIGDDARKIKFCQVFMGQTGEDILMQLTDDISWEEAKRELIDRLGDGTVEEEAWTASKGIPGAGENCKSTGTRGLCQCIGPEACTGSAEAGSSCVGQCDCHSKTHRTPTKGLPFPSIDN